MSRTVRDAKLETRTARAALKASGVPYWRSLEPGLHLGYRKGAKGGVWVVRRLTEGKRYQMARLGIADDRADPDGAVVLSFAQAQAEAHARMVQAKRTAAGLPAEAKIGPYLVRDAIASYLAYLDSEKKSGRDARWRAEALILPALGGIDCARLTADQITTWRDRLAKAAPRLRTKKGEKQRFRDVGPDDPNEARRRRQAGANRVLTTLKAALNRAHDEHKIASDAGWRRVKSFKGVDAARVRYLTTAEATRLINGADAEFRPLVQAGLLTGCRFGELAAITAGDFNPDSRTLHIRTSKSGKGRHVVLTDEGAEFFRGLAAGRSAGELLLPKADGGKWGRSHQARPMRDACERAGIKPAVGFHTLRHTWASLSVMAGLPLLLVAKNLGHSDTRMVEKHYGHMEANYVSDMIRDKAPRFGIAGGNLAAIR